MSYYDFGQMGNPNPNAMRKQKGHFVRPRGQQFHVLSSQTVTPTSRQRPGVSKSNIGSQVIADFPAEYGCELGLQPGDDGTILLPIRHLLCAVRKVVSFFTEHEFDRTYTFTLSTIQQIARVLCNHAGNGALELTVTQTASGPTLKNAKGDMAVFEHSYVSGHGYCIAPDRNYSIDTYMKKKVEPCTFMMKLCELLKETFPNETCYSYENLTALAKDIQREISSSNIIRSMRLDSAEASDEEGGFDPRNAAQESKDDYDSDEEGGYNPRSTGQQYEYDSDHEEGGYNLRNATSDETKEDYKEEEEIQAEYEQVGKERIFFGANGRIYQELFGTDECSAQTLRQLISYSNKSKEEALELYITANNVTDRPRPPHFDKVVFSKEVIDEVVKLYNDDFYKAREFGADLYIDNSNQITQMGPIHYGDHKSMEYYEHESKVSFHTHPNSYNKQTLPRYRYNKIFSSLDAAHIARDSVQVLFAKEFHDEEWHFNMYISSGKYVPRGQKITEEWEAIQGYLNKMDNTAESVHEFLDDLFDKTGVYMKLYTDVDDIDEDLEIEWPVL
jgi:hypothetical protein